jgi:hypothetical protein
MTAATEKAGEGVMQEQRRTYLWSRGFNDQAQSVFPDRVDGSVRLYTYEVQP